MNLCSDSSQGLSRHDSFPAPSQGSALRRAGRALVVPKWKNWLGCIREGFSGEGEGCWVSTFASSPSKVSGKKWGFKGAPNPCCETRAEQNRKTRCSADPGSNAWIPFPVFWTVSALCSMALKTTTEMCFYLLLCINTYFPNHSMYALPWHTHVVAIRTWILSPQWQREPYPACSKSPVSLCHSITIVIPMAANCSSSEMNQVQMVLCNVLYTISHGRRAIPVQAEEGIKEKSAPLWLSAF